MSNSKHTLGKQNLRAKWSTDKRWQPISRSSAAEMLRANRRHGAHCYRYDGELHIENRDVHFVIRKDAHAAIAAATTR
jgi:hypothetical protein